MSRRAQADVEPFVSRVIAHVHALEGGPETSLGFILLRLRSGAGVGATDIRVLGEARQLAEECDSLFGRLRRRFRWLSVFDGGANWISDDAERVRRIATALDALSQAGDMLRAIAARSQEIDSAWGSLETSPGPQSWCGAGHLSRVRAERDAVARDVRLDGPLPSTLRWAFARAVRKKGNQQCTAIREAARQWALEWDERVTTLVRELTDLSQALTARRTAEAALDGAAFAKIALRDRQLTLLREAAERMEAAGMFDSAARCWSQIARDAQRLRADSELARLKVSELCRRMSSLPLSDPMTPVAAVAEAGNVRAELESASTEAYPEPAVVRTLNRRVEKLERVSELMPLQRKAWEAIVRDRAVFSEVTSSRKLRFSGRARALRAAAALPSLAGCSRPDWSLAAKHLILLRECAGHLEHDAS